MICCSAGTSKEIFIISDCLKPAQAIETNCFKANTFFLKSKNSGNYISDFYFALRNEECDCTIFHSPLIFCIMDVACPRLFVSFPSFVVML